MDGAEEDRGEDGLSRPPKLKSKTFTRRRCNLVCRPSASVASVGDVVSGAVSVLQLAAAANAEMPHSQRMWLTNGDNEANKKLLLRWISLPLLLVPFAAAVIFLLGYRSQRGGSADLEVLVA